MYRSNETVQRMIEWLEQNLSGEPGLLPLSKYVGYSPWYCSALFHQICGMTLRSYVAKRRLTMAALALRDENSRILDVALDSEFSGGHVPGLQGGLWVHSPGIPVKSPAAAAVSLQGRIPPLAVRGTKERDKAWRRRQ